ncbi:NSE4 domain-containing protein [Plasmodium brasilianum]|uniref:Uncharacterized protein n=2 Tax=Plasmodium (Plasmodium) TaxID=418103 RepID=A0A1D3JJJ3_PLAMA|nr:conserved Plasmodium protein, unknown function [Plasmodium malariae]KAI4839721.1 NSE4 domain-containing protein [Plasmodium brasilianum]SBT86663.1 conserved Plasmodium protein, unknown function [Plasmodium malariae]
MSESEGTKEKRGSNSRKIDELYIQNEIDKLNVDELIQPEQNNALKKVIKTDRKIVMNLDNKISKLQKSCQYGKQVSKIINFKAEGLSTISLKEKLKLILDTFNENFNEHFPSYDEMYNYSNDKEGGKQYDNNDKDKKKILSFAKISHYFSVKTFSFCTINYDTIPLNLFFTNSNTFNIEIKEKKVYSRTKQLHSGYKKLKEYTCDNNEPEIKLETYEQSMKLKHKLSELEKINKHINFLHFIIDCDPMNGFNETTFRLFLITLLVSKGHVEFYKDDNNILCIKSLQQHVEQEDSDDSFIIHGPNKQIIKKKKKKKNQTLLTSWSYHKWEKLAKRVKGELGT